MVELALRVAPATKLVVDAERGAGAVGASVSRAPRRELVVLSVPVVHVNEVAGVGLQATAIDAFAPPFDEEAVLVTPDEPLSRRREVGAKGHAWWPETTVNGPS